MKPELSRQIKGGFVEKLFGQLEVNFILLYICIYRQIKALIEEHLRNRCL
jgi:hypothetical protein